MGGSALDFFSRSPSERPASPEKEGMNDKTFDSIAAGGLAQDHR